MKAPQKQTLLTLPVPQTLLKRIRAAEMVVMEESIQQQMQAEQDASDNKDFSAHHHRAEMKELAGHSDNVENSPPNIATLSPSDSKSDSSPTG